MSVEIFFRLRRRLLEALVLSLFSFFILAISSEGVLAAPNNKSIFSKPQWMKRPASKKTASEEKAGSKSTRSRAEKAAAQKFYYPSQIKISPEFGTIQESYQGKTKKLIIHFQDAHCNYEAQKKAARMLEGLVKDYGLKLVLVEGGSGDVSLSYLRDYGTQELREKVAEEYLRKGEIAGEEYLDIISDLPFSLYGIETDELYNVHLDSFWKVESFKEKSVENVSALKELAGELKKHLYNKKLKALESKKLAYEKEKVSITDYYRYFEDLAQEKGLDLTPFPNFRNFTKAAQFEKNIQTEEITADAKKLVENFTTVLPEKKLKQLLTKSAKYKLEKIEAKDYYFFLKQLAQRHYINLKSYPYIYNYIIYLELSDKIDGVKLIKEARLLEKALKEKLFKNSEEKKLSGISENIELLTNLINLQMTPDEYGEYEAKKADFNLASWLEFLNAKAEQYKLREEVIDISLIDTNIAKLESYYQAALKRDSALINNSITRMARDKESMAVLIAGGFHTPQLTRLLKEKGYSYLVVSPKITESSDHNVYLSVLKNRKPLGKNK